ncbi:Structural maintenance of chromosomes protein 2 [Chionoecetes opilio]|uniref:Structural maintenance of chromosomes protein n=1 Tax=Chionoecetes opilio TaxID=41210 RepID=A0A8J5CGH9_CHIOP|nr:Structural maintenance of chromosomes protein 2 [Chionoecetes opilio]
MFIKSIVIDGFKSYGQRTEINGFDPLFNAITGLNGSGKSNILDSICFLLGITNLSQVRATNLQELVYKNGQAGVTKATVSITFDNTDKNQSPIGYDHYSEVTITRQVVIGGRNKYMINGSTVQNSRVQDFFRSVQLNVNNPHFLIMQGRITKVLTMKPPEILAMIEEAAGTRMYEAKKQQAEKTIKKKDAKLLEMNTILAEEINPALSKLKEERSMYLEYQKVQRELEHLSKLYIAYKFVTAQETSEKAQGGLDEVKGEVEALQHKMSSGAAEIKKLESEITILQEQRDKDTGEQLQAVEKTLKEMEKEHVMRCAALKNMKETLKAEEKKKKQLEKSLADDMKVVEKKRGEGSQLQGKFDAMRSRDEADGEALAAAERRLQAISSGMYSADDGEDATLQEQLIRSKARITEAKTATQQADMKLSHCREELKQKRQEMKSTAAQYEKDKSLLDRMEKTVTNLKSQLEHLDYDESRVEELEGEQHTLKHAIASLQERMDHMEGRYPQLCFNYKDPERNWNHASVKGMVCKLVSLKDTATATALEVVAGGKLYNVIVDTEDTGKKLLQKGQLQRRVTIIPLNKISGRCIDAHTVRQAEALVGRENVQAALSLVCYDSELHKAMEWVFGGAFVCKDMDAAKRVAFDRNITRKAITLDGDVFDPAGTLTGGARRQGGSILAQLDSMREFHNELNTKTQRLEEVKQQLHRLQKNADKYASVKQEYTFRSHELEMCRQRIEHSTHYQHQEEIRALEDTMNECVATLERCKQVDQEGDAKVKEIENKIKNSKAIKEQEMKAAKAELGRCKKVAEETRSKWNLMRQDEESLKLETKELEESIEATQGQIATCTEVIQQYKEQEQSLNEEVAQCKSEVEASQAAVREAKERLNAQNKEIKHMAARKEEIIKIRDEAQLAIQQLEHKLTKLKSEAKDAENHVKQLLSAHEWIAEDRKFFGKPNTGYDFNSNDPVEAGRRITRLEEAKSKLSKNVNMRAMNMLGKAEEQYNDLMRKITSYIPSSLTFSLQYNDLMRKITSYIPSSLTFSLQYNDLMRKITSYISWSLTFSLQYNDLMRKITSYISWSLTFSLQYNDLMRKITSYISWSLTFSLQYNDLMRKITSYISWSLTFSLQYNDLMRKITSYISWSLTFSLQYNDLMRKKRIVENDKSKIEKVILELDEKKKAALRQAWEQVNKDFGSIFSTLLPGTQAKLQPPEGQDVLDGLEFKVAFGGVWKESLTELSGGQKSLVALSLILSLLLFKPAPIYILDEVDAALDLSHTQNIGNMLRIHFKHSQFVVVSLKDGMFNNANVLFKTRFVDGMSTVSRHTQHGHR